MEASTAPFNAGPVTAEIVAREARDLPVAAQVLPKLKRLLQDGNSSMSAIVTLLRLDPGLAVRVLRVGSSAYYGSGVRCQTLEDAVTRVGYNQIYEIVAYAVASQVLIRPVEAYGLEADQLWRRSVACALAAELLAIQSGADYEEAYTVGLLHSVGLLAMDDWMSHHHPGVVFASKGYPREWTESERALVGVTQPEVGAALLTHWDFPLSMTAPVRWQQAPGATAAHRRTANILYVARWIQAVACGEAGGAKPPAPDATVLAQLQVSPFRLESMVGEVRSLLAVVCNLLEDDRGTFSESPFRLRIS